MERVRKAARAFAAGLTLLLAAMAIAQAVDLCMDGGFSREQAAGRLASLAPVFWLWLASVLASAAAGGLAGRAERSGGNSSRQPEQMDGVPSAGKAGPERKSRSSSSRPHVRGARARRFDDATARDGRRTRAVRWIVGAAALAFLALGAANGGAWDVLVKAINICTECIGLG